MKPLFLLLTFLAFQGNITGQTAEEFLLRTEGSYRRLTNYVDEGTQTRTSRSFPFPDTTTYVIAMDRNGNVNHWFHREKNGRITGGKYVKSDQDTMGTFTRLGTDESSLSCNMSEASARLGGRGGGMFFLLGSLFYPGFFTGTSGDSSAIRYFDTAKRLDDTTIHDAKCFVIETHTTIVITQQFADKANFRNDSTNHLLQLPVEQRGGPRAEPGPRSSARKYFIRKSDYMIVRVEELSFKDDTDIVNYHSVLALNPKYDVKEFADYLED